MAKKKKNKTPAPSGCTISRNKNTFTLTWKIAAKNSNDGQKRRYYINGKLIKTQAIKPKDTKTSITSNAYPLSSVKIEVQDDQKKGKNAKNLKASAWKGATFSFVRPPKSTVSLTFDENYWNRCTLSWGHEGNTFANSDNIWYLETECQTTWHDENHAHSWVAESHNAETGSYSKQESSTDISGDLGYVRGYRFRIKGKAGYTTADPNKAWVYAFHYYSTPKKAEISSVKISNSDAGGVNCSVEWNSYSNTYHPIDYSFVQYGIAVPGPGLSCPSGISWTDRPTMKDNPNNKSSDKDSFYIDTPIGFDNCLFARVVNVHDKNRSYSKPVRGTGIVTDLSLPDNFSIGEPDPTTYRVTVSIDNQSDVPDSNIAIIYRSVLNGVSTEQIVGIIPHGVTTATIQCPNFDIPDEWSLGAFAFVGDFGSYQLTSDISIKSGKKYYTRTGNEEQTATEIQNPSGNPHEQEYYEKLGDDYYITDDTTVVEGKTYYTLSQFVPYSYTQVTSPVAADLPTYYELVPNISRDVSFSAGGNTFTYSIYEIPNIMMRSGTLWQGGDVPRAPENVKAICPREGVALVTWDWAWKKADIAELSWSDHDDAWESTDQPETYRITNTHSGKWSIYGLESGVTWYIRVRLIKTTSGGENYGPWSSISSESTLDMASAPNAPILTSSKLSVTHDDSFTVSWEYNSTDGTDQANAVLRSVTLSNEGEIQYGTDIRSAIGTNRSVDLIPDDLGWETGNKYGFVLKVISESGKHSEWSDPAFITVAEPLACSITSTSFENHVEYVLTDDTEIQNGSTYYTLEGTAVGEPNVANISKYYELSEGIYINTLDTVIDETKTYYTVEGTVVANPDVSAIGTYYERSEYNILREMPITLSANISGGVDGQQHINASIERASSYFVDRPDETTYSGYSGETVYSSSIENASSITISQNDLIGNLDDTASYKLTIYVYDDLDQTAEDSVEFKVDWAHQAAIPDATVEFDDTYDVVKITPSIDPAKFANGDTFDIYRLSADKPVLIVKGGTFGQTYVDPYPTIGTHGGHRVVTVTANGDFISNEADSDMAWIDLDAEEGDIFMSDFPIVNFGEGSFTILYNADLSTNWTKDFRETRYLGGHIQGDWNAGIHRDSTINSVVLREEDAETITLFRRMAEYPGLCHIRTLDGSNYYADIQLSETIPHDEDPTNSYSFKITRVDSDGYDGIELSEWNKIIGG
jgi:hypothetical protein